MKVAIYTRVSTTKQDETLQIPRCEEFARRHGWEIYKIYQDEASGKDANRPGWKAMESDMRRHEFDAILVTKLDRIMRSLKQLLGFFEDCKHYSIMIITVDQGIIDMSSPTGRMQANLLGMLAEWEREIISERTKEAIHEAKKRGVKLGRPKAQLPIHTIALMRVAGKTWGQISTELGISPYTMKNHRREIWKEVADIKKVVSTCKPELCDAIDRM